MTTYTRSTENAKPSKLTVHVAFVKDTRDFLRYGRIRVYIPDFRNPDEEQYWVTVQYASPFAGATNPDRINGGSKNTNYEDSQESYGWWAIPPDVNNEVLVVFANGQYNRGYFFACVYQEDMNHSIPTNASSADVGQEDEENRAPTVERNKKDLDASIEGVRPIFTPLYDQIKKQGLIDDFERGPTDSSARRDIISQVFGLKTPRGHSIYIDDGELDPDQITEDLTQEELAQFSRLPRKANANELIRVRTRTGAQLILNDTLGYLYFITKKGDTWIELSDFDGVDVYTKHNINLRTQKNINIRCDGDMNLEVGGNFNSRVIGNTVENVEGTKDIFVKGSCKFQTDEDYNLFSKSTMKIETEDSLNFLSAQDMIMDSKANLSGKSSSQIMLDAGAAMSFTAGGELREQASAIHMNSGAGAGGLTATESEDATLLEITTKTDIDPEELDNIDLESFLDQSGIITHEPFAAHPKIGDDLTDLQSPVTTTGTNGLVEEDTVVNVKSGAINTNDRLPANIQGTPQPGLPPGCYHGAGYDEDGNPIYEQESSGVDTIDITTARISQPGLNQIKQFEGRIVDPTNPSIHIIYDDQAGKPTIGYGHLLTESDIQSGRFNNGITESEAEALLRQDAAICEEKVRNEVTQPITQSQFDSLVSFCFNVGGGAFGRSTLLRKLNQGDYAGAVAEFGRWNKITDPRTGEKVVSNGLTNRRRIEARQFAGDC